MAKGITRRGFLRRIAIAAGAISAGCSLFGESPYAGMGLYEVVNAVSTPRQAQEFMNYTIDYAHGDVGRTRPSAVNGAEVQSFRSTFGRGRGVCRDGAVAVAAMLQDNGYPSLILDFSYIDSAGGHSVFVYQGENGLWGSAGINASDYKEPVYPTLEGLAWAVAINRGDSLQRAKLHDLSLLDLVEGTNILPKTGNSVVAKRPFIIRDLLDEAPVPTVGISMDGENYRVETTEEEGDNTILTMNIYDPQVLRDIWRKETYLPDRSEPQINEMVVLDRYNGLPSEETSLTAWYDSRERYRLSTSHSLTCYDSLDRLSRRTTESFDEGELTTIIDSEWAYNPDNSGHRIVWIDDDADGTYDRGRMTVFDANRNIVEVIDLPARTASSGLIVVSEKAA
ncbi:hypothetical protein KY360_04855 [Candidatus Woesearchaeota archaeon]|nr:hypothetical protein [Candidatus Woesearchaeota archaeon]